MTDTRYRHRRTSNPSTPFPNPIEPGEIAVNTANRQIAVGDAGAATGTPLPLIALRYFSTAAAYVANDLVYQAGVVYRANTTISPGAFNASQWDMLSGAIDPKYVEVAGDVMTGALSLPAAAPTAGVHATNKTYVDTRDNVALAAAAAAQGTADSAVTSADNRVLKAGDVMTGMLTLPVTAPSVGEHATNKTYVDAAIAAKASVVVSPTPPVGVPDNTLWFENDSGKLFLKYNDGTGATQWVEQVPNNSAVTSNDVSYLPQVLAASEATQARKNVYAAPFDALAYNGMQINGAMEVSQERGTAATTSHNAYICDGWRVQAFGTMAFSAGIASNLGLSGMPSYFYVAITTAQASLGASDLINSMQAIEGYRISRLGWGTASAQPLTIGFWSSNTPTGVYSGTIRNGASNRSYGFTYTQNAANIPQYNTVTIPGDTTGAWAVDNTVGLFLCFTLAAGTGQTLSSANTWTAGNFQAAPGQINGAAAINNALRITGVGVFPGSEAPTAARSALIMRPYDQELVTCQRYYEHSYNPGTAPGTFLIANGTGLADWTQTSRAVKCQGTAAGNRAHGFVPFMTVKRNTPTVKYWCWGGTPSAFTVFDINGATSVNSHTADGFRGFGASVYGVNGQNGPATYWYSSAMWQADARL